MTSRSFPATPIARLSGHNGPVHALTFSAGSGQYLLTGSADRSIRLFNPITQRLIQSYNAHGYEVLDLAVSSDNARFASVGGDKTVFLWDVATAQTLRRWVGHSGRVNAVALGGEGGGEGGAGGESVIVSGSFDGTVRVWDTRSRSDKAIMTFSEAKDSVSTIAVHGHEIYAGSIDGRVRVYDVAMGMVDVDCIGASVGSVQPTLDGQAYLASTLDNTVRLMDRPTGKILQAFKHKDFKNEAYRLRSTLAVGDELVISGSEDGSLWVWDVLTGAVKDKLWHRKEGEQGAAERNVKKDVVSAVAWNQMRKMWASAGGDGDVVVWGKGD